MRSQLELIAFSDGCVVTGTLMLLDSTVAALESAGDGIGAAYVDLARQRFILNAAADCDRNFDGIGELE